jgi:ribonuclease HII
MSLPLSYSGHPLDAGVDEAGRGCLAGPVVAAAVILPTDFTHPFLTDSKQLSQKKREALREEIQTVALAWKVGIISPERIDQVNVLNATYEAMHQAIAGLSVRPALLSIDGNRFRPYPELPHHCLVKGDSRFLNIAAASILAKTYRDDLMRELHLHFPQYAWDQNKGYPTQAHRRALGEHGPSPHHRQSFRWKALPSLFDQ